MCVDVQLPTRAFHTNDTFRVDIVKGQLGMLRCSQTSKGDKLATNMKHSGSVVLFNQANINILTNPRTACQKLPIGGDADIVITIPMSSGMTPGTSRPTCDAEKVAGTHNPCLAKNSKNPSALGSRTSAWWSPTWELGSAPIRALASASKIVCQWQYF